MALKVLLADDNITAQRMGSKILIDAGYTVVAVSNGAAAVKKIAAERPDLAILDVFMPGYSGLEVCEKMKNAAPTARVPVLLTVTNMEPYSVADGNRVKADGVLIKPFEATDLLAVIHKFEEKLKLQAQEEQKIEAAQESEEPEAAAAVETTVQRAEVPSEMAMSPALGIEDLEETSPAETPAPVATFAVEEPAAGVNAPAYEAAPAPEAEVVETPAEVEQAPPCVETGPTLETGFEPVIEAATELPAEVEPAEPDVVSAAEGATELPAQVEPGEPDVAPPVQLAAPEDAAPAAGSETSEEPTHAAEVRQESALAIAPENFAEFTTKFGAGHAEDIPIGIAMEETPAEALEAIPELLGEPVEEEPAESVQEPSPSEMFEPREPVVEAEPEPEPEYDTQRIHAAAEEPEFESRHIPVVNGDREQENHHAAVMVEEQDYPAPTLVAEPEPEMHSAADSVQQEPPQVLQVAAAVEQSIMLEQAEPETQPVSELPEPTEPEPAQAVAVAEEPLQDIQEVSAAVPEEAEAAREPELAQAVAVAEELQQGIQGIALVEAEALPEEAEAPVATTEAPAALEAQVAEELERAASEAAATTAEPEMEPPAEAAAATTLSEDRVADAVHRVLDRYKGELIAAIVRELKN